MPPCDDGRRGGRRADGSAGDGNAIGTTLPAAVLARLETEPEALERRLRRALADGEIVTWFQPQVRLADHGLVGFETLVRWRHPDFGLLMPARFIRVAERRGVAAELDAFGLERGVALLARLDRHGVGAAQGRPDRAAPALRLSVNITPDFAAARGFADRVERIVADAGVSPERIVLEITERGPIANWRTAWRNIRRLRRAGFRVALDDFGSGYSSLGLLKELPVDEIKVDRLFLRRGATEDVAILTAILQIARVLKLSVLAEGVENADQERRLLALGCEMAQGYRYGRPMPGEDVADFVACWPASAPFSSEERGSASAAGADARLPAKGGEAGG